MVETAEQLGLPHEIPEAIRVTTDKGAGRGANNVTACSGTGQASGGTRKRRRRGVDETAEKLELPHERPEAVRSNTGEAADSGASRAAAESMRREDRAGLLEDG